jgi:hypothetical protein
VRQADLFQRIETWEEEDLISPQQAQALKRREKVKPPTPQGRLQMGELLVYLGSLVVFLALAMLVGLNWTLLGSALKVLLSLIPTIVMLGLGWWLHDAQDVRLKRGAQALWLGACLLSVVALDVIIRESGLIANEQLGLLASFGLATGLAGITFVLVPSITQGIALHLCGSGGLLAFLLWMDYAYPPFSRWRTLSVVLVAGGLWLALSEWLWVKKGRGLETVSRLFASLTIFGWTVALSVQPYEIVWQKAVMEAIATLLSIAFITLGLKRQSRVFLYTGAACFLFLIVYVNLEHFADKIGIPVAVFVVGVLLIVLGLGTGRLGRWVQGARR